MEIKMNPPRSVDNLAEEFLKQYNDGRPFNCYDLGKDAFKAGYVARVDYDLQLIVYSEALLNENVRLKRALEVAYYTMVEVRSDMIQEDSEEWCISKLSLAIDKIAELKLAPHDKSKEQQDK